MKFSKHKFIRNIPNNLTILRMLLVPAMIGSFFIKYQHSDIIVALIILSASITDFFDGYLARMWNVQSSIGRLFDPIADKLLVVSAITMLIYSGKISGLMIFPSLVILCREIFVSGLREFLAGTGSKLPPSNEAKVKTALQMMSIIAISLDIGNFAKIIGEALLWSSAIVTLWSCYKYSVSSFKHIKTLDAKSKNTARKNA